ncbi:hypothetical protein [Burkholderia glumae]
MTSRQNIKLSAAQRLVMQPLTDAAMREALDEFELVCENNDVRKLTDAEKYAAQEFALSLVHGDPSAPVTYAETTDKRAPALILTGAQLLEALDFIAPDRTADQFESEVSFQYGKGHSGEGIYCWITEYPDEGASLLDGSTVAAHAVAANGEASDELLQLDKLLADFHTTVWHAGAGDNGPIDFDIAGKEEAKAIQRHVRAMLAERAAVSPDTADRICTLIPLSERHPIADDHPRVIVFTDGSDFNGAQFFDVSADTLNECFYESPDEQPEVCRHATHWMPRPSLHNAAPATADERALRAEVDRLNAIINTPQSGEFHRAVSIEAEHQRQRWAATDANKTAEDWAATVAYLVAKAMAACGREHREKYEHHIITAAAALANWHLALDAQRGGGKQ